MLKLPKLFLINDDEPTQFAVREVTIVRDDVRVEGQPGLAVMIEPPIENAFDGPLGAAIVVARHEGALFDSLVRNAMQKPASVFVCRFSGNIGNLSRDIPKNQLSIVFWGLLGRSREFGR